MPGVTYIEFNGAEHKVEVPVGTTLMRGAVDNNVPGIDADWHLNLVLSTVEFDVCHAGHASSLTARNTSS